MLASPLPTSTAAAPATLALGLPKLGGESVETESGGFGALFQRAVAGWAAPTEVTPAVPGGAVTGAVTDAVLAEMPGPAIAMPGGGETEAATVAAADALTGATEPAEADARPAPATSELAPATAPELASAVPDPSPPMPVAPAAPLSAPPDRAAVVSAPATERFAVAVIPRDDTLIERSQADRPRADAASEVVSPKPPASAAPSPGTDAEMPWQSAEAAPPATVPPASPPGTAPVTKATPPPSAGKPPPVILALPAGVVPRLVAGRPVAAASGEAPPTAGPVPARPSTPAASPDLAAPAPGNEELKTAWWPELAPHPQPAPTPPSAGKTPVAATIPLPEAAAARAQDLAAVPAAAMQGTAASEPAHIAPPSPTRQVLPITIAMLISPGTAPTLTVTLEPGEMGQVEIRVGRDAGGTTLRLIAERPETAALMQRDGRELQQGLAQSGIRLDAGAIQFETAGHGAGQQRDRPPPREPRRAAAMPPAAEPVAPVSLLDMRI